MGVENYKIGRGEFMFSLFVDPLTRVERGFLPFGNCPGGTFNRTVERIEHMSSMTGVKTKDFSQIVSSTMAGSVTTDEVSANSMAMFLGGTAADVSFTSGTGVTSVFNAYKGATYQLGVTASRPNGLQQIKSTPAVTVTGGAGGSTSYTAGTDYTIDYERGTITFLLGGTITDGGQVTVTYSHDAYSRFQINSGAIEIEGALRFYDRAEFGQRMDWYLPWVKLTPNGDVNLIGDELTSISWNVEVLRKGTMAEAYIAGKPIV